MAETPEAMLVAMQDDADHLFNRRMQFAIQYLDDGNWHKRLSGVLWVRRLHGQYVLYRISSDTIKIGKRWQPKAAAFLWKVIVEEGSLGEMRLEAEEGMTAYEQSLKEGKSSIVVPPIPPETPLTHKEREYAKRIPPDQDVLSTIFGYDNDNKRLFRVNGDRLEYLEPSLFIPILGKQYATWRVVSMLLFNNPYGVADHEKHRAILSSALEVETPPIVVDKRRQEFRYKLPPPKRAPVATAAEVAERGEKQNKRQLPYTPAEEIRRRRDEYYRDKEADAKRVAEIRAEQEHNRQVTETRVEMARKLAEVQGKPFRERSLRKRLRRLLNE